MHDRATTIALADSAPEMARYDAACRALAEAKAVDEVKDIRDQAMAMRLYAKQAKNRELEADAYELRVRAERKLGELIAAQKATVGLATGGEHGGKARLDGTRAVPTNARPTLAEAGIDKKLSSKAQKMHAIPSEKFEAMVKDGREEVQRSVERRTIKAVEIAEARADYESRTEVGGRVEHLHGLVTAGRKFAVLLADPPWDFTTYSDAGKDRSPDRHYGTMSLEQIKALPVDALAADNAVLFLWSTWPKLLDAIDLTQAWGFSYKTDAFLWVKQNRSGDGLFTGLGYWTRANSEPCLLATRGSPQRLAMDVHQVIMAPVGEHSAKPAEAHERIERLLAGPYLELFARAERPGWTTWGNEISRESAR
jgi:N6-adenosine-specific RNA methylase IME4